MPLEEWIFEKSDGWLEKAAPSDHVALSSRARFARNVLGFPFTSHAKPDVRQRLIAFVAEVLSKNDALGDFEKIDLAQLEQRERTYLVESRLISREMEKGASHHVVYVAKDALASIMVNEEDHLRLQVLSPGLSIDQAVERLKQIDVELGKVLGYAQSDEYGYLTACPTNVGSAFRASVMLHLPGVTLLKDVENALQGLAHYGLVVRGFYGENSEFTGDLYQISNEVTLGKNVDDIVKNLMAVIGRVIEREEEARLELFRHHKVTTEDTIWRSFGMLTNAMRMGSSEAMKCLSSIRLGIDRGFFKDLSHTNLNSFVMHVQPAHVEQRSDDSDNDLSQEESRAQFLRNRLRSVAAPGDTEND